MKKILSYLILYALPIFASAQKNFEIIGQVAGLTSTDKIFLIYDTIGKQVVDSAIVNKGVFRLNGSVSYPVYASLFLGKNPYINKLAKGEKIDYFKFLLENAPISMTAKDSLKNISIDGSPINKLNTELRASLKGNEERMKMLGITYNLLTEQEKKDSLVLDSFIRLEKKIDLESVKLHLSFAKKYPNSYLSVFSVVRGASKPELAEESKLIYNMLSSDIKNSPVGKSIPLLLASHKLAKIGAMAPDFEQKSPDGKIIKLSDFKNKYVLLDFWASWCGPCREENPNLVASYEKFKAKGFQIFGVSLDDHSKKQAWIEAISTDQLTWPQVSDLNGWENAVALKYGVRAIPANFLIDPSGKIIAKDLRGKDLSKQLEALFKD